MSESPAAITSELVEIVMSRYPDAWTIEKPVKATVPSIRKRKPGATVLDAERLRPAGRVQLQEPAALDGEADGAAEARGDVDLDPRDEALGVDPEAAVDEAERAERRERDRAVDDELDPRVGPGELEPEVDLAGDGERVPDHEVARHQQPEAADDADRLRGHDQAAGAVALEAVEDGAVRVRQRAGLRLERLHRLRGREGVELEQELAVQLDAREAGRRAPREEDPADDARLGARRRRSG